MKTYQNILETLEVIKKKDNSEKYMDIVNTILNLLNEEETGRFTSASLSREFKTDHLNIRVSWNGKILE